MQVKIKLIRNSWMYSIELWIFFEENEINLNSNVGIYKKTKPDLIKFNSSN